MSFAKHAIALAFSAVLPVAAHATVPSSTFNFYFDGAVFDTVSTAPSYVSGNLQLTVRAFDASGKALQVSSDFTGLGATSGGFLESGGLNAGSLFGGAPGEYLTLTFNKAVNVSSVRLSGWSDGVLGLGAESGTFTAGTKSFALGSNNDHGLLLTTFATTGATGTVFKLQATGKSEFRLGGLNVTAAVPEPGSYALMALGLVGIGLVARRRAA